MDSKVSENRLHHQVRGLLSLSHRLGSEGMSSIPPPNSAGNPSTTAVVGISSYSTEPIQKFDHFGFFFLTAVSLQRFVKDRIFSLSPSIFLP